MPDFFFEVKNQKRRPNVQIERPKIGGAQIEEEFRRAAVSSDKEASEACRIPGLPRTGGEVKADGDAPQEPANTQAPPVLPTPTEKPKRQPLPPRPTINGTPPYVPRPDSSPAPPPLRPATRRGLSIPATLVRIVRRGMKIGELKDTLEEKLARESEEEKKALAKLTAVHGRVSDIRDLLRQTEGMDGGAEVLP